MAVIKNFTDGFKNILKGLGGVKDHHMHRRYAADGLIDRGIANSLFRDNWLFSKGIKIPIEDGVREWIDLVHNDPKVVNDMWDLLYQHDFKNKFATAAMWARVFGGAALLFIFDSEDMSEPLDVSRVKKGSLKNILVLDRYFLTARDINTDLMSSNFGLPDSYIVSRSGTIVHHTRVVPFFGLKTSIYDFEASGFWGIPVTQRVFSAIADTTEVSHGISSLVQESNIDVYQIKGLNELVAMSESDIVLKRLRIMNEMKSYINGVVLDAEDSFTKRSNTFSELPAIDDRFLQKVAGAFDIPMTRLLGISPAGQNSTGVSDLRNYYDNISAMQENEWRFKIDRCLAMVRASLGATDDLDFTFKPLYQMSEVEKANSENMRAQRDVTYMNMGAIELSDVMAELVKNETYSSITSERVEETKQFEEDTYGDDEDFESGEEEKTKEPEKTDPQIQKPGANEE